MMRMGDEIYVIQNKLTAVSGRLFIVFYGMKRGPE